MRCVECGGKDNVKNLRIISLSSDQKIKSVKLCIPCLREKKLYCEEHGIHMCVSDDPKMLAVFSACCKCALEATKRISTNMQFQYADLMRKHLQAETIRKLLILGTAGKTENERIVYGLNLFGMFNNATLEETISELISGGKGFGNLQ